MCGYPCVNKRQKEDGESETQKRKKTKKECIFVFTLTVFACIPDSSKHVGLFLSDSAEGP